MSMSVFLSPLVPSRWAARAGYNPLRPLPTCEFAL